MLLQSRESEGAAALPFRINHLQRVFNGAVALSSGLWEAGASHAEPELRPTTGGFVMIDGPQRLELIRMALGVPRHK